MQRSSSADTFLQSLPIWRGAMKTRFRTREKWRTGRHFSLLFLAGCFVGCATTDLPVDKIAATSKSQLQPKYEYQIRLDPAKFVDREKALDDLQAWLATLNISNVKFTNGPVKPKKRIRQVDYLDTANQGLATKGWRLRRRQEIDHKEVDLTLKANGQSVSQATALRFDQSVNGLAPTQKLERDIYANPNLSKWAYSASFKSKSKLPPRAAMTTPGVLALWYPQAAAAINASSGTPSKLLPGEQEYHWRGKFFVKINGEPLELELLLPYRSLQDARDGGARPIEPELSWKPAKGESTASQEFQESIRAAWGQY
jgi:hypothetical protein